MTKIYRVQHYFGSELVKEIATGQVKANVSLLLLKPVVQIHQISSIIKALKGHTTADKQYSYPCSIRQLGLSSVT